MNKKPKNKNARREIVQLTVSLNQSNTKVYGIPRNFDGINEERSVTCWRAVPWPGTPNIPYEPVWG